MDLTNYSDIQQLLKKYNFNFSKSLGQNFLIKQWVPERIAESSFCKDKTVLEIGPGIGCLTKELSFLANKVNSVELDKTLFPILSETLSGCENVEVFFMDALKGDLPFADVVCANLPYNITTPILTKLINNNYEYITVMVQKEVAKRICASEKEKDYSAFGIFVQWSYDCEYLFDVTPDCFMPMPKVTSAVIRLKKLNNHPYSVSDEDFMFKIIRAAFNQRRKTLANGIANICSFKKDDVIQTLETLGYDSNIRGEVLSIGDFAKISEELIQKK